MRFGSQSQVISHWIRWYWGKTRIWRHYLFILMWYTRNMIQFGMVNDLIFMRIASWTFCSWILRHEIQSYMWSWFDVLRDLCVALIRGSPWLIQEIDMWYPVTYKWDWYELWYELIGFSVPYTSCGNNLCAYTWSVIEHIAYAFLYP